MQSMFGLPMMKSTSPTTTGVNQLRELHLGLKNVLEEYSEPLSRNRDEAKQIEGQRKIYPQASFKFVVGAARGGRASAITRLRR